jgi:hypothetical protein
MASGVLWYLGGRIFRPLPAAERPGEPYNQVMPLSKPWLEPKQKSRPSTM